MKTARDYAQRMADDGIIDHLKIDEVEYRILRYMAALREESGNFTGTNIPVFPLEEIEVLKDSMHAMYDEEHHCTPRQVLDELHRRSYRIVKKS